MEKQPKIDAQLDVQIAIIDLSEKITEISSRLETIEKLLNSLVCDVKGVHTSTKNMDEHITFVNGVYSQIHRPFHALINAAGRFVGGGDELECKLPSEHHLAIKEKSEE